MQTKRRKTQRLRLPTKPLHHTSRAVLALLALLALTACGSLGGILGDSGDRPKEDFETDLRGAVVEVDSWARRIVVDTSDDAARLGDSLRNQGTERTIYYDQSTVVEYEGDLYEPEDLERGDLVAVSLDPESDRDLAERISVLRDVTAGSSGNDVDRDLTEVRGVVAALDREDRAIDVEQSGWDRRSERVHYDERTVVLFEGREYEPENLERGDEIRVTGTTRGDRFLADRITVEQDVRSTDRGPADADTSRDDSTSDNAVDVRGTVRSIDSRDRRIELDLPFGARGDERVFYDERTVVELDGRELRPESLREGDQVSVSGTRRDNRLLADSIVVVREARGSSSR